MDDDSTARAAGILAGAGAFAIGLAALTRVRPARLGGSMNDIYTAADLARKWGAVFKVPPQDVLAIAGTESSYNPLEENHSPRAETRGGAWGMMQLLPATAADLVTALRAHYSSERLVSDALTAYDGKNPKSLLHADLNIMLGAYFLSRLEREFGSFDLAAAGYQQGPGTVRKAIAEHGHDNALSYLSPVAQTYVTTALGHRARIAERGVLV